MKPHLLLPLVALVIASCATAPPKRYAMVTGLKPEREKYYRELHAEPWPSVMAKLRECNIHNYSIHRIEIGGKPYLIGYFEYTGNDFDADGNAVTYSITGGNTNGAFAINTATGVISVANSAALDYETTTSFGLTVSATDGGAADTATITEPIRMLFHQRNPIG